MTTSLTPPEDDDFEKRFSLHPAKRRHLHTHYREQKNHKTRNVSYIFS